MPVFTYPPPRHLRSSLAVNAEHPACPYRRQSITAVLASNSSTSSPSTGKVNNTAPGRWPSSTRGLFFAPRFRPPWRPGSEFQRWEFSTFRLWIGRPPDSGYNCAAMYRVIVLIFAATLLSACSTKFNLGEYLPEWAGGTPKPSPPPSVPPPPNKDVPKPGDCSVGGCPQR